MLKKINEDLKNALKSKETTKVLVLRGLLAALQNEQIKIGKEQELTEERIIQVLSHEAKKRKDAIELYLKGNRPDKAENEKKELKILQNYLPEQLTAEELMKIIDKAIQETGAQTLQDKGKVMGKVMATAKGKADGKEVKEIVQKKLS